MNQEEEGNSKYALNKPLKKIAYSHQTDLGIYNLDDRIACPVQPDLTKFQRMDCWAVTDFSVKDVIIKVFELTTISDPNYVTLKMPMPYSPSQDRIAYLNTATGVCVYFHENGSLWSADQYSSRSLDKLLNDPTVEKNPRP